MRSRSRGVAIVVLVLAGSGRAAAQDVLTWLSKRANVQQVIKDKNSTDRPAYFSLTYPKGKPAQKDASVAADLEIVQSDSFFLGPCIEYVQKSGDKPQDQLTAGANSTWLIDVGPKVDIAGTPVSRVTLRNETEVKYKNDAVAHARGLSAATRFAVFSPGGAWTWGPYLIWPPNSQIGFRWEPRIGIEYDNAVRSTSATPEGATVRTYAEIGLYLYPFARSLRHRFVLSFSYAHRRDLATPSSVRKDDHYFRVYSALIYLDADRRFALGLDRVSGQDPSNGFAEQAFVRVSLKVRFAKS
jgi:hypothetical protein